MKYKAICKECDWSKTYSDKGSVPDKCPECGSTKIKVSQVECKTSKKKMKETAADLINGFIESRNELLDAKEAIDITREDWDDPIHRDFGEDVRCGTFTEGADIECPNCGELIGKASEVEGNHADDAGADGYRRGTTIKLYCSNCAHKWRHRTMYDTRE